MTGDVRDQVHDATRYLRQVRPIDPAELTEYVTGGTDPETVREILRTDAVELGLVEHDDGTFGPPSDDPIAPTFTGVSDFPDRHASRFETLLESRYGTGWASGESGERLKAIIRDMKADYYRRNPVEYDLDVAFAYGLYHLPAYYAAIQYVLDDLGSAGLLPGHLRVLDVGAGVGGPALGLAEYVPDDVLVDYHAVEPSAATEVLEAMLLGTGRNVHTSIHREDAESFDPDGEFDLVLFANVLNELDRPETVAERYFESVADDGALIALEPADKNTSAVLRTVERDLADRGATVFAPTLRLWPDAHPSDDGWSFDVQPDLDVPSFQRSLDTGDGSMVNVDVQYAYAILRHDDARLHDVTATPGRYAAMGDMERHVTNRVDLLAVKLSHSLADEGHPLYKIGDGSERVAHFAVRTRPTSLNGALADADYGSVLAFENALVLWNDDEAAYNVVVDGETVVEQVA